MTGRERLACLEVGELAKIGKRLRPPVTYRRMWGVARYSPARHYRSARIERALAKVIAKRCKVRVEAVFGT